MAAAAPARSASEPSQILLACAPGLFEASLEALLETSPRLSLVGRAHDADQLMAAVRSRNPGLLLLSMDLPLLSERTVSELEANTCRFPVVAIDDFHDEDESHRFVRAGSRMVRIDSGSDSLIDVIHNVLDDAHPRRPADASTRRPGPDSALPPSPGSTSGGFPFSLTRREVQVIVAITEGLTNRHIAESLGISPFTVKHHLTRIFDKLGVFNRLELALFAMNHNLPEQLRKTDT
jgi:DNA-binding NarL/FixJ family response regulator